MLSVCHLVRCSAAGRSVWCHPVSDPVCADDAPSAADISTLVGLLELVIDADADSARSACTRSADKIRSGEVDAATLAELKKRLAESLGKILAGKADDPLAADAALSGGSVERSRLPSSPCKLARGDGRPRRSSGSWPRNAGVRPGRRGLREARRRAARREKAPHRPCSAALAASPGPTSRRSLASFLRAYPSLGRRDQPQAIELLTQRAAWSKSLVAEIAAERLAAGGCST